VREALRARRRRLRRLVIEVDGRRDELSALAELAGAAEIPVEKIEPRALEALLGSELRAQGVALEAGPLPEVQLDAMCAIARPGGRRLVVLDGVEDPQNVGAIARVAESAGCIGMVLSDRRAPGLTPAVSRASAGAIEWLPVARVTNLVRALEDLKAAGYWIFAADLDESRSIHDLPDRLLTGDLAVVLGAEGRGIRPGVRAQADHRIRIPMLGEVASLNVATAGAVILYDLVRRANGPR